MQYYIEKRNNLEQMCIKVVSGKDYVNPSDYIDDGSLSPERYTPEMYEKFSEKCDSCDCIDKVVCRMRCIECFNRLFNKVDDEFVKFVLEKNIGCDFRKSDEENVNAFNKIYGPHLLTSIIKDANDESVLMLHNEITKAVNNAILDEISKR